METSTHRVSPLRQRMLEDMRMRKLAPKTRDAYIRAVSRFAQYLGRSPDTATAEDLRRYQLHLVDAGTSPMTLMRDTTERPEAVQAGTVKLVGTEAAVITQHLRELLTDTAAYQRMSFAHNPYGDGNACQRIVQALAQLPRKHHSAILGA